MLRKTRIHLKSLSVLLGIILIISAISSGAYAGVEPCDPDRDPTCLDTTPPQATIDSVRDSDENTIEDGGTTTSSTIVAEFSSTDSDLDFFECKLTGDDFSLCSSPVSFELPEGSYTLQVRAIDLSGNIGLADSHSWSVVFSGDKIRKCLCKELTAKLVEPKDFKPPLPPKKFGNENPKVSVEKTDGKTIITITAIWQKTIICVGKKAFAQCTGFIQFGSGERFELNDELLVPDPELFGLAQWDPKNKEFSVILTKDSQTQEEETIQQLDCKNRCKVKREKVDTGFVEVPVPKTVLFATKYVAVLDGEVDFSGQWSMLMSAFCGIDPFEDTKQVWSMDIEFTNGEFDFDNSDFDNDDAKNKDEIDSGTNPYDPNSKP